MNVHLHWVTSEAPRVAGFPEALLAGRDEAGRDGVSDNLSLKDKFLGGVLWQRLHVAHHTTILSLATCMHQASLLKPHSGNSNDLRPYALKLVLLHQLFGRTLVLLEASSTTELAAAGVAPTEKQKYEERQPT